jgi:flagellar motor switch protein FliG
VASITKFNGPALLISMLREVDPAFRRELCTKIASFSPEIARLADHYELLYMDMLRVTDQTLPQLITQIPEKTLLIAWRLTRSDLRSKMLAAMSERRREAFIAEVESSRPVPKAQVYHAQDFIVKVMKKMLDTGKLRLESKSSHHRKAVKRGKTKAQRR